MPIVGVSCSEGATVIDQWIPGISFFIDAVTRLQMAKEFLEASSDYRLRNIYMVWCQGESDGDIGTNRETYYSKLNEIVTGMVKECNISQCFVVRIGNRSDDDTIYNDIMEAQTQLCRESEYCTLVSTFFADGEMYDTYHYTQVTYNEVGREAGENAGKYVVSKVEPDVWDYKWNRIYVP